MLLKEHRFIFFDGAEKHLFRIEELVEGVALWPGRFRLILPATVHSSAATFYGASCDEVAAKAGAFTCGRSEQNVINRPAPLPQAPRLQMLQVRKQD